MIVELYFFFFKQKTAYEMRISDWSSDVCSSDLEHHQPKAKRRERPAKRGPQDMDLLVQPHACFGDLEAPQPVAAGQSHIALQQIGRASCRERVCQYV